MKNAEFANIVWNDDLKAGQFALDDGGAYTIVTRATWRRIQDMIGVGLQMEEVARDYRRAMSPDARESEMPAEVMG